MNYIGAREIISLVLLGILIISTIVYKIWRKTHAAVINEQMQKNIEEEAAAHRRELEKNNELEDDFSLSDSYNNYDAKTDE